MCERRFHTTRPGRYVQPESNPSKLTSSILPVRKNTLNKLDFRSYLAKINGNQSTLLNHKIKVHSTIESDACILIKSLFATEDF